MQNDCEDTFMNMHQYDVWKINFREYNCEDLIEKEIMDESVNLRYLKYYYLYPKK